MQNSERRRIADNEIAADPDIPCKVVNELKVPFDSGKWELELDVNDKTMFIDRKASRDGFDANAFHTHCNNKGPTMTIVRSNNNFLFGGYTAIPWTSDNTYKNDTTAFLFTLTNPHHIPPTKYPIQPGNTKNAVYHGSSHGPFFGSGALYLSNNSNFTNSVIGFPSVYTDTTGKGVTTFTGAANFLASDIEVFKLV